MRLNGCTEIPYAQWSGKFGNSGKATQMKKHQNCIPNDKQKLARLSGYGKCPRHKAGSAKSWGERKHGACCYQRTIQNGWSEQRVERDSVRIAFAALICVYSWEALVGRRTGSIPMPFMLMLSPEKESETSSIYESVIISLAM